MDASLNDAADQNETTISLNPDSNQVVIASANDYRAGLKPEVYRSTDGGASWVNYQVGGTSSLYYGDPAMAFDQGNHTYFSYLGYTAICTSNGGMYVSNSSDAGATFSAPVQLAANSVNGSTAIFHDKEYVAVDTNPASPYSGTVYVGWTKFIFQAGTGCGGADTQLDAPVVLSKSTDHGLSWSIPITASQPISDNNQAALPVIGRHGEVYLYYVGAATQHQLNYDSVLFSRSTDGGQTFPFFTRISDMVDLPSPLPPTSFRNNGFGAMAADQTLDGYLYTVWADYRTGDADILLSRSTDNGNTWSAPVRVNDDPSGNGKDQFFPWIATSPDGYVHIAWLDRREDPTNHDYKEYYTYSTDHGVTWQPNVAISTVASNPGTSNFIGDYTGLAAGSGVVMPNWTDIRSGGNQNAYVARGVYTPDATATATATNIVTATDTATSTTTSTSTAQPPTETPTAMATETATATECVPRWDVVSSPNQSGSDQLLGVAVVSANDIWAVGYYYSSSGEAKTLVLHWDGTAWGVTTSPNVGTYANVLNAVAAVSANDIWAVGTYYYNSYHNVGQTLILHWDGSIWSVVPSPSLSTHDNVLLGVAAVSANDVWAVGSYRDISPYVVSQTLILHWDGSIWSVVPSPNVGTVDIGLYAVAAVSANDVWAVGGHQGGHDGGTLIEHWNGNLWSVVPSPNLGGGDNALLAVAAVSANDVWAVGGYHMGGGNQTLVARYNSCQAIICTISFEDVPVGSTFYPYIQCLACRGIMSGYPCGGAGEPCNGNNDPYFRPGNNVTRGQFAKITSNAAGFVDPSYAQQYEDVLPGSTFYDNIWRLSNRGYINGYPCGGPGEPCGPNNLPYFRPNANVTRGQIAKIDANAAGFNETPGAQQYEDVLPGSTFYDFIWRLSDRGIISG